MREMWNMIKQRQFKVKKKEEKAISFFQNIRKASEKKNKNKKNAEEEEDTEYVVETMTKSEQMNMIRSLFNIMIHGVSHERLLV